MQGRRYIISGKICNENKCSQLDQPRCCCTDYLRLHLTVAIDHSKQWWPLAENNIFVFSKYVCLWPKRIERRSRAAKVRFCEISWSPNVGHTGRGERFVSSQLLKNFSFKYCIKPLFNNFFFYQLKRYKTMVLIIVKALFTVGYQIGESEYNICNFDT